MFPGVGGTTKRLAVPRTRQSFQSVFPIIVSDPHNRPVNPDSNPDRSSADGATGAIDILPGDGNGGSADSPPDNNKVSGKLDRCRR